MDNKGKLNRKIFIVDDEESILDFLKIMLSKESYDVQTFLSPTDCLNAIKSSDCELVITDIKMPEMNGIELLQKINREKPNIPIIVMTAHGSTESAVEAMKLGACDYLTKPFKIDEMKIAVRSALKTKDLEVENRQLRQELGKKFSFDNIIGNSNSMASVFDIIKKIANTKINVMILGESGTGKELIAHAIHHNSETKNSPFIVINCAAIPESLFESELFGHKKGSFTGATEDKKGLFEMANGGTLFLDEVGEIPLATQVKLLRAIQQRSFMAVGATKEVSIDVRFICATNRDLEAMVKEGNFREDLFYRLNVIQIRVPPLRERKEDIPMLCEHFLNKFNLIMGKSIKGVSIEAAMLLQNYSFPGNVRELENIIERSVALESQSMVFPKSLPQKLQVSDGSHFSSTIDSGVSKSQPSDTFDLEHGVEEFERTHIMRALEETKGVKKKAAKLLGISFRSLRYRIEKYKIQDPNPEEKE